MQWLIDIATEAMEQYLIDNPRYVDRGDPASVDYGSGDFTKDGNWHELDLSAIVPENARGFTATAEMVCDVVEGYFLIRKHGNVNTKAVSAIKSQIGGIAIQADFVCGANSARKIDYKVSPSPPKVFYVLTLTIKNWWL